jgi:hypothetical protein
MNKRELNTLSRLTGIEQQRLASLLRRAPEDSQIAIQRMLRDYRELKLPKPIAAHIALSKIERIR